MPGGLALTSPVPVAGPGTAVGLPLTGRQQPGVAAGVGTGPHLQPAVTLLPLLHHEVATEARTPVVLLLPRNKARLRRVPQDGVQLLIDLLETAGGKLKVLLTAPTAGHYVLRSLQKSEIETFINSYQEILFLLTSDLQLVSSS